MTQLLADDPFDQELARRVKVDPSANPAPAPKYHLLVVGGGPAGLVCAFGAAGLGAKVALVERHLLGGDCLTSGCVPSKTFLAAARTVATIRDANAFGIDTQGVTVDFGEVMRRVRRIRAGLSENDSTQRIRSEGIDLFGGDGAFTSPNTFEIEGTVVAFSRAILCTGSRPNVPDIPGLADIRADTNETIFARTTLPRRLAILGAGAVACELAQGFRRFGSEVTILGNGRAMLPKTDPACVSILRDALIREGVSIRLDELVRSFSRQGDTVRIELSSGGLEVDAVLVATGRSANVENLGLERVGVAFEPGKGVEIDDHLRTTCPTILAAGDICAGQPRVTHGADAMARLALRNALFFGRGRVSELIIPQCVYTEPELASVGRTKPKEGERVFELSFDKLDRAATEGTAGSIRVVVPASGDTILGATIVGPHAGETIGEVVLAMSKKVGLGGLSNVIHPYPTYAEAIRKTGDAYQKTRLTKTAKWFLKMLLKWKG